MNKVIVTTTINDITPALERYAAMKGWTLVVVLDRKTPPDRLPGVVYLSCKDQEKIDPKLSDLIGWNSIQRRNFGFLYAYKELKADILSTVDDDNIPLEGWGERLKIGRVGTYDVCQETLPVFDPVGQTNYPSLWHRGYPLELVAKRRALRKKPETFEPDVQADFWQTDADVDAVCRMTNNMVCRFSAFCFPIAANRPSPFNSQNTFLTRRVVPHYFMHVGVGRFDDILGSYHVQAQGFRVIYGEPSVEQKRNDHDLMEDFRREVWGQENCLKIASRIAEDRRAVLNALPERSRLAFEQYQSHFE